MRKKIDTLIKQKNYEYSYNTNKFHMYILKISATRIIKISIKNIMKITL